MSDTNLLNFVTKCRYKVKPIFAKKFDCRSDNFSWKIQKIMVSVVTGKRFSPIYLSAQIKMSKTALDFYNACREKSKKTLKNCIYIVFVKNVQTPQKIIRHFSSSPFCWVIMVASLPNHLWSGC